LCQVVLLPHIFIPSSADQSHLLSVCLFHQVQISFHA
jgi:hypothetical protein